MLTLSDLPALNAFLNAIASFFLISGFLAIQYERQKWHALCMISAFVVSALFLVSYLIYHLNHPPTTFTTPGWPKILYFLILFTHIPLAILNLPLILATLFFAARQQWETHRKLARWTWPLWMYVSVTGVLVYLMLYQWFPPLQS